MESGGDIADPTDWLATPLAALAPLDAALRCQVCKDLFDTPMLTSCSHTFCSLCIRRCLAADGRCPACRAPDQASRLRQSWAVQEAVDAFAAARPGALLLARRAAEEDKRRRDETEAGQGSGCKARGGRRKRKAHEVDADAAEDVAGTRQTRSQTKRAKTASPEPQQGGRQEVEAIIVDDTDDNDEDEEWRADEVEDPPPVPPPAPAQSDGLVPCPICQTRMKEEAVYSHLDTCDGTPKPSPQLTSTQNTTFRPSPPSANAHSLSRPGRRTPTTSSGANSPAPRPERIPQLNYSLLRDTALRKKLAELGIPSWGTRPLLIRRHTEWVNLWNANCDAARPRGRRDVLAELDAWERSQGGHSAAGGGGGGTSGGAGVGGLAVGMGMGAGGGGGGGAAVMRKDFDGKGWAERNADQFRDLVARAREKRARPGGAPKEEEKEERKEIEERKEEGEEAEQAKPASPPDQPMDMQASSDPNSVPVSAAAPSLPTRPPPSPTASPQQSHPPTYISSSTSTTSPPPRLDAPPPPPFPPLPVEPSSIGARLADPAESSSIGAHLADPARKMPMFAMPQEPVRDVDVQGGTGDQ